LLKKGYFEKRNFDSDLISSRSHRSLRSISWNQNYQCT